MEQILPGVWKIRLGEPEEHTPVRLRFQDIARQKFDTLPPVETPPFSENQIIGQKTRRGYHLRLPLVEQEQIYGLGLQLLSFNQRRHKKTLRVNSDPRVDLGDSHAPVPFYVSNAGYGVLVDTARYATFYFGPAVPRTGPGEAAEDVEIGRSYPPEEAYRWTQEDRNGPVLVDIPACAGVDIYLFAGPGLREAVQRYNLFSGGGCLPPRWGLGVWYRTYFQANQERVLEIARGIRSDGLPCDVIGLEPGWQGHSYPCSFTWNKNFPDPGGLNHDLAGMGLRSNLWTHAFTHVSSPIYKDLLPYAGDFWVLGGLVPDLLMPEARAILAGQHAAAHVDLGVSGYKLDECDNTDYNAIHWSFPESSQFPSGLDGEVMHSLLGLAYQETIEGIFRQRNQRTYGDVRSSYALAAPYPFVLYSDLYDHQEYIRGLVTCGFSGLLWTPEVRDASSAEDLIRRLQVVVLSPQALINAWYIQNPPWKQWRTRENNAGQFLEDWQELQEACRQVLELRMRLLPYLYAAFTRYHLEGLPPFRALVMDYPQDANVFHVDGEFLLGDRLLAAPVTAGHSGRKIYLPDGAWVDFWTGERLEGGRCYEVEVPLERIPLFVKDGSVLPLARPAAHSYDSAGFELEVRVYGDGHLACDLIEDDGTSWNFSQGDYNRLRLGWDQPGGQGRLERIGRYGGFLYRVVRWIQIDSSNGSL